MGNVRVFKGFAGIRLEAEDSGPADAPSILLLHGLRQTRGIWNDVASELEQAGRHVINLDLRGHGGSEWPSDGRYDFNSYVEDLRAVLAQMQTRPVVVAATLSGWVAMAALADDAATLAAGLVLADVPEKYDPEFMQNVTDKLGVNAEFETSDFDARMLGRFITHGIAEQLIAAAPKINIPVLYVRGALSHFTASAPDNNFASAFPDAQMIEVEDAGRLVIADRTEAFNALLIDFLEHKHPRALPEYRSGSDARTLRDAMGTFATGVTIITAHNKQGDPIGLTANSFTSVSLDPPLLLVCIANSAGSAEVLRNAKIFNVNVLQIGQQPTSNRFAGKGEDRFAHNDWEVGEYGAPVLHGSLCVFECERDALYEAGDHFILIGRVEKASFEPRRDPLLYFRGKYRRLHFA